MAVGEIASAFATGGSQPRIKRRFNLCWFAIAASGTLAGTSRSRTGDEALTWPIGGNTWGVTAIVWTALSREHCSPCHEPSPDCFPPAPEVSDRPPLPIHVPRLIPIILRKNDEKQI